jgi:hypothetical protein
MTWAPDYVTEAELKTQLRIEDDEDDTAIAVAIAAASRAIDQFCGRQFGQVAAPEARVYTAEWDQGQGLYVIPIDDCMSVSGLSVMADDDDDQTYDKEIDSYRLFPFNAEQKSRPWTRLIVKSDSTNSPLCDEGAVEVTAVWGWESVPQCVVQACLIQAGRFFVRRDSLYGIAGSPDVGSELRLLDRVDPDVALLLQTVKRRWAAA